ncbi:MAG: C-N hydrolase family amidase [Methanoregulaceae archaeon PtaB.Bin056]|jgi:predicted amidohydrolase|nr:MAG: C-N hydrolase family amidase [Methanoregulaceae archaeon PtaB.Bin056]
MKLFCAQVTSVWEDPVATLKRVEPCIARASRGGGDLICFPEQFATGWDPESSLHVQGIDGPITGRLRSLAEEYSIAILGSFREETGGAPRNTCVVVSSDGEILSTYSKCHLFSPASEDLHYTRGDAIATFSIRGIECGLAICYDLRFTSLFRLYADAGVHAVLVPAAWPEARLQHWELFIRTRALEYQVYVAGINTTGITPVDLYGGGSMVADPTGGLLARAGREEALISCELDREYVELVRAALPVARDRRDDLGPPPERRPERPAKNR